MTIRTKHLRYAIVQGIVLLGVISCEPWPPGKEDFVAEFSENRYSFERLLDEFNQLDYAVLEHGGASGGAMGIDSTTGAWVALRHEEGSYIQNLLEQARVYRVSRVNGDIVFLRPVGPEISGQIVRVEFIYRSEASDLSSCDEFAKSDSGIECEYHLDAGWYLHYFWARES